MRFTRYIPLATLACTMILTPVSAPAAASKEMQDLQRDVAQLQDQVTALQKAMDTKVGAIQAMLQQLVDTANKTSSNVTSLNSGVTQTMQSEFRGVKEQLTSVNGLSVKVDNASNDISDLHNVVAGLVQTVNKEQSQLNDISNQIKLLQAPPAPAPGVDTSDAAPGAIPPPPSGQALYNDAKRNQDSGHPELALPIWANFLKTYPNDPNAIRAQYNIGEIHYYQGKLDEAVKDFNDVIEIYPADPMTTPTALYMKGLALKKLKKNPEAALSFRAVIKQFPSSDEASQAKSQLTSMGLSATTSAPGKRRAQ